jgi:hypothetical protein
MHCILIITEKLGLPQQRDMLLIDVIHYYNNIGGRVVSNLLLKRRGTTKKNIMTQATAFRMPGMTLPISQNHTEISISHVFGRKPHKIDLVLYFYVLILTSWGMPICMHFLIIAYVVCI